ncbi:hypothetical protein [Flavobacterium suncheonense]|uniref:Uncharacterized protein n=1 Tax=Flavobacterium suncheonense GH29-5 = DSM 17707 TaxID=1121899 RepID=A0A0A2MBU7_9FLAO|nr:hypothetical protein [Flavobacterium suncheonense]KGO85750.1 hypothetical protein Q764_13960 [Flavobacterium suncheonense GH29-5 = DSM 17707]
MQNRNQEIEKSIIRNHDNKLKKLLKEAVLENDTSILDILRNAIEKEQTNGAIINEITKAYFRLKRKNINDCSPLFELMHIDVYTVQESLLEILGYDKVVPSLEEQKKIIEKYFDFGSDIDLRYFSDPRYGLAAACAGWNTEVVEQFLKQCLTINDVPLKYVTENSLKKKYVRLR